jgi:hypothetical protein
MNPIPEILFRKLCYIFHRGFVEARTLARMKDDGRAEYLADTFEVMPTYLTRWDAEMLEGIRSGLAEYQKKYAPSCFDYLAVLDMDDEAFMELVGKYY